MNLQKKSKLIKHIKELIQESKEYIFERAERIMDGKLSEDDKLDLVHIDVTGEIFTYYDWVDSENHHYDLGSYWALSDLLRDIENNGIK